MAFHMADLFFHFCFFVQQGPHKFFELKTRVSWAKKAWSPSSFSDSATRLRLFFVKKKRSTFVSPHLVRRGGQGPQRARVRQDPRGLVFEHASVQEARAAGLRTIFD